MRALFALFTRAIRDETRSRILPVLCTGMLLFILFSLWETQSLIRYRFAAAGLQFFQFLMMINFCAVALIGIALFPSAITEEKEDKSLPLLRMTNLSPLSILFGKGTSRMVGALILLSAQVPFTLLAITLGGVGSNHIWGAYAVLACSIFVIANLALLNSVLCRTSLRASILTTAGAVLIYVALPILFGTTTRYFNVPPGGFSPVTLWEQTAEFTLSAHPGVALILLLRRGGSGIVPSSFYWFNLGLGLLCFVAAWALFDRCANNSETLTSGPRQFEKRKSRKSRRVRRTWTRFALAWKDFHFLSGGRRGFVFRLLSSVVMYSTAYFFVRLDAGPYARSLPNFNERLWRDMNLFVFCTSLVLAGAEFLLIASRLFGVERRQLTLSSLVGLPWSIGRLVRQKVAGSLFVLVPWLLIAVLALVANWSYISPEFADAWKALKRISWRWHAEEICVLLYISLQALLWVVLIVWSSLRFRRGAIIFGLVGAFLWNILFAFLVDRISHRDEVKVLLVGVMLTIPALVIACFAVHGRIQTAASEH